MVYYVDNSPEIRNGSIGASIFLVLSRDIISKTFSEYLIAEDISRLDIACCSTMNRPVFLDVIHRDSASFEGIKDCQFFNDGCLRWLGLRNISVKCLKIADMTITDEVIYKIACPKLEALSLRNSTGFSSLALSMLLERCEGLAELQIDDCEQAMNNCVVNKIAESCCRLKCISIEFAGPLILQFRQIIESCRSLTMISLRSLMNVDNDLVILIAECLPSLVFLDISGNTQVNDVGVSVLPERLSHLEYLSVEGLNITDVSLTKIIQYCRRLQLLKLNGCGRLSASAFLALTDDSFPRLRLLDVAYVSLSNAAAIRIGECCKSLEEVHSIPRIIGLTDAGVIGLATGCGTRLKVLNITYTEITDNSIRAIAENCPNLEELLCGTDLPSDSFTFAGIEFLGKRCPKISKLDISGSEWVNRKTIKDVINMLPFLSVLKIIDCSGVNSSELSHLRINHPNLEIIDSD
jgi:hypothetical protein